jgi:hypothetical protein
MTRFSTSLALAFILLAGYCINSTIGSPNGINNQSKLGCSGGDCHGSSASPSTSVNIWTDSTEFHIGQTYVFHISVVNPSTLTKAGGCDISADNGAAISAMGSTSSDLKTLGSDLTHKAPKLKSGDSITWSFKYTPKKTGLSHIFAAGNAVNNNGRNDAGDLWNRDTFTTTVTIAPGPSIVLSANIRDTAMVGATVTSNVWVKNVGTAALTINHFALKSGSAWFIADSTSHSVAIGDSIDVKVSFAPTAKQTYNDTLFISSNDATTSTAKVALVGVGTSGVFSLDKTSVGLGAVALGSPKMLFATITNNGNAPLTISGTSLQSKSGAFSFVNASTFPVTLKPGAKVVDTFKYLAAAAGFDTATVTVDYVEATAPKQSTITLTAEASADLAVAPLSSTLELSVAPNPTSGTVALRSTDIGDARITVINEGGRAVRSYAQISLGNRTLDLSELPTGTYFLRIEPKEGAAILRRIVIQR